MKKIYIKPDYAVRCVGIRTMMLNGSPSSANYYNPSGTMSTADSFNAKENNFDSSVADDSPWAGLNNMFE